MTTASEQKLTGVLEEAVDKTEGDEVALGEVLETFDNRAYGPLLLVPALIALSPVGAIPGMSVVTGSIIFLICAQIVWGKSTPWLPKRLTNWSFPHEKLERFSERTKPWTKWIEKFIHRRWAFLAEEPFVRVVALICMALALSFFPLALLPFAVAIPAAAISFFALGLTSKDGLLILLGFAVTGGTVWFTVAFWPF